MKIYDREGFPNPVRVRAVVAAKGLESQIQWVPVDLIANTSSRRSWQRIHSASYPCSSSTTALSFRSRRPSRRISTT
jgi:hypothetical protein